MLWVNIKLALASLKSAKLRSFLTMVAVIIGVAAFTIITTTVEGLRASFAEQINSYGGNLIAVNSGKIFDRDESGDITDINFAAGLTPTLTEQDFLDVVDTEGIVVAAPMSPVSGIVRRGETETGSLIIATNQNWAEALNQKVKDGVFLRDEDGDKKTVVVGADVSSDLFGGGGLGSTLTIGGQSFVVVGVLSKSESSGLGLGPDLNNAVFISLESGKELSGGSLLISEIDAQTADPENIQSIVGTIEQKLLENHSGEQNFAVATQEELTKVFNGFIDILKLASQAISYIMLFVGGIVILLIMLITVGERTREIGIRKSIGATSSNIMTQFLTESVVITLIGSLIGLAVAYLVGLLVAAQTGITPVYSAITLVLIVVIGTIIGGLAGLYPAYQAAKKDPVEALRHS